MEKLAGYLNRDEPLLACALVRLCRLALEIGEDGMPRLNTWEQKPSLDDEARQKYLQDGFIPPESLRDHPLCWLKALDKELPQASSYRPDVPVTEDGAQFWVVRRPKPEVRRGYRDKQYGNLFRHLHFHYVFPANVDGIATCVRPQTEALSQSCARILDKNTLTVAVVRFDDQVQEIIEKDPACTHLHLSGLDCIKRRYDSALHCIDAARTAKVDMLVFPELSIPPEVRKSLMRHLHRESRTPGLQPIAFVLLGSFHEVIAGKRVNRATLVSHDGMSVLLTDKRAKVTFRFPDSPADSQEEWGEALQAAPTPFGVLALDIGLLTTAICKDVFDGEIRTVVSKIGPDWLLAPSMTNKIGPHTERTEDLAKAFGTISIVANQPMPGDPNPPQGYVQTPRGRENCVDSMHIVSIKLDIPRQSQATSNTTELNGAKVISLNQFTSRK